MRYYLALMHFTAIVYGSVALGYFMAAQEHGIVVVANPDCPGGMGEVFTVVFEFKHMAWHAVAAFAIATVINSYSETAANPRVMPLESDLRFVSRATTRTVRRPCT
mmetsp:Transcript_13752/g.43951  ORF Transcript_13752/g.43951 Transcript_13752/m.43951 type:complete len:106 (+) Transcript_13752:332-649(+)